MFGYSDCRKISLFLCFFCQNIIIWQYINLNNMDIRNIVIIVYVDYGKMILVDKMIFVGQLFVDYEMLGEFIFDSNDLEWECGIIILFKNVFIIYKGIKINIIDIFGYSDFGGEVECVLNMVDGVLLLVDVFEGFMLQICFVI